MMPAEPVEEPAMRRYVIGLLALAIGAPAMAAGPVLVELLDEAGLQYERQEGGKLKLLYRFDDGRSQLVFLVPQGEFEGVPVVEIYSPVMRLQGKTVPAALANRLLEVNGARKLTYFGVEAVGDGLVVFCYHNTPTTGLGSKALATLLLGVATFADEMEKEQLGAMSDEY
jgi:hypothetical protein